MCSYNNCVLHDTQHTLSEISRVFPPAVYQCLKNMESVSYVAYLCMYVCVSVCVCVCGVCVCVCVCVFQSGLILNELGKVDRWRWSSPILTVVELNRRHVSLGVRVCVFVWLLWLRCVCVC